MRDTFNRTNHGQWFSVDAEESRLWQINPSVNPAPALVVGAYYFHLQLVVFVCVSLGVYVTLHIKCLIDCLINIIFGESIPSDQEMKLLNVGGKITMG